MMGILFWPQYVDLSCSAFKYKWQTRSISYLTVSWLLVLINGHDTDNEKTEQNISNRYISSILKS